MSHIHVVISNCSLQQMYLPNIDCQVFGNFYRDAVLQMIHIGI